MFTNGMKWNEWVNGQLLPSSQHSHPHPYLLLCLTDSFHSSGPLRDPSTQDNDNSKILGQSFSCSNESWAAPSGDPVPTASSKCVTGCFECCIKCLGGVPYASLVATILCFSGVALFCGCGHVALAGTVAILEQHFSTNTSDHALLSEVIQLMQYVIYGIASFFFLYGIILLAEGFYTTSAVKELHGEFKTTACGRCISGMFVFLTYVLGVAWLGVFGFSAVPVFMFYNIWSTCEVIKSPQTNGTAGVEQICVDIRQYGIIPWNAFPGRICGSALENICNTNEFYMSYHLFIVACAGAGATVIALLIYMMATTYNYAVLKFKSREDCCTKF